MYTRLERLKNIFLKEINNILLRELSNTLLDQYLINIVDIHIKKDLSKAEIYVSLLDEKESLIPVRILNKNSLLIQKLLGKRLHLKRVPRLYFYQDTVNKNVERINHLLKEIKDWPS